MKNTIKKIIAVMLSLVMIFGCMPSFISDANGGSDMYLKLVVDGSYVPNVPSGTSADAISFKLANEDKCDAATTYQSTSVTGWTDLTVVGEQTVTVVIPCSSLVNINGFTKDTGSFSDTVGHYYSDGANITLKTKVNVVDSAPTILEFTMDPLVKGEAAPYIVSVKDYDFNFGFKYNDSMEDCYFRYGGLDADGYFKNSAYLNNEPYSSPITIGDDKYAINIKLFEGTNNIDLSNVSTVKFNGTSLPKCDVSDKEAIRWGIKQGFVYLSDTKTISLCFVNDLRGPKTPIEKIKLDGEGILAAGFTPSLKYKENDDTKYTSTDASDSSWYTAETCSSGQEANSITGGVNYYKKVTVSPKSTYEFTDTTKVEITDGTLVSKTLNGNNLDVIIKRKADTNVVAIDFEKLTDVNKFDAFDSSKITVNATKNPDYKDSGRNTYSEFGFSCVEAILEYNAQSDRDTIEKIYFRGKNIKTDAYKADQNTLEDYMQTHDIAWYTYDDDYEILGKYWIVVVEKCSVYKFVEITFDTTAGKTVADTLNTRVVKNLDDNGEAVVDYACIRAIQDDGSLADAVLPDERVLEAGKKYVLDIQFGNTPVPNTYKDVMCNGEHVPNDSSITSHQGTNGWKAFTEVSPADNKLLVHYEFEAKAPSSGRKKKKTDTKPVEPKEPTPEEKVIEELTKEDVKKANSNEKEKINPSAKFIKGYDDGTFKPERNVNNIELMSMVTELYSNVDVRNALNLNQGENYWGEEIIQKANTLGLVPGNKDDKNYNVQKEVTRGELAIVVYDLLKDYSQAPSLSTRENCKDAIGETYETAVTKLVDLGILKGFDDGLFHGDYTLTRAEAVVVINRALRSLGFEIKLDKIELTFPDLTPDHWAYSEIMYAANK